MNDVTLVIIIFCYHRGTKEIDLKFKIKTSDILLKPKDWVDSTVGGQCLPFW